MHPTIGYQLSQNHLADLRHQAQHAALARDGRHARPHRGGHLRPCLPDIARRALTALATRSHPRNAERSHRQPGLAP